MTIFTSASVEIVNQQPNLSPDELTRLQIALEQALENAAEGVLDTFGIVQESMPTIILTDLYQADSKDDEANSRPESEGEL